MMGFTFLTVLGFLGLLGIGVLILIYLLKPNYQQKVISSTYVWKLSLKYRRRKVPISKWRNILLIICQFLIVILCAWILAQPVINRMVEAETVPEGVVIIDTSANMMAQTDGTTRFDRALQYASDYIDQKYDENGLVTIIMAGENSATVVGGDEFYRASITTMTRRDQLRALMNEQVCSYGGCDPESAINMAEVILEANPNAEILFVTATEYSYVGAVKIVDIKDENREWNAAILSCQMSLDENDYLFSIELACYDREQDVDLLIDIVGANDYEGSTEARSLTNLRYTVRCEVDSEGKAVTKLVEFKAGDCEGYDGTVSTFDYIYIRFDGVNDSFAADNEYYVYGGTREEIRVQLWSKDPNSFFSLSLFDLGSDLAATHDIFVTSVRSVDEPAREGFDIYLFEHAIPDNILAEGLPTDGVVFLCDPDSTNGISEAAGFSVENYETMVDHKEVNAGVPHPITQYLRMDKIKLTKYRKITSYDSAIYQEVMSIDGSPIMLVRNEPNCKIFVMSFSVNYSTLPIEREFPLLIYNMLNYFIPLTMDKHVATVGEEMSFYGRGDELYVTGPGPLNEVFTEFPNKVAFTQPGTYRFTQRLINGEERDELLYVRITPSESNIFKVVETLTDLGAESEEEADTLDLLLYFAIALVTFLFVEWWLQSKEYFA